MQHNSNTNYVDPSVKQVYSSFQRLSDEQKTQMQLALLNDPQLEGDTTNEKVTTWKDIDDIVSPAEWDWPKWLVKGFLTILASESGMGKSHLMLWIASRYLVGGNWPDGAPFTGEKGAVLWAETEAAQGLNTLRAKRWRLPIDQIYTPHQNPLDSVFIDKPSDRKAIQTIAERSEVKLIVLDSLSGSHSGKENSSEMLHTVGWLAELARDTGKPVLVSHHLRKKGLVDGSEISIDRIRGSSAIVQTPRTIWGLDQMDSHSRETKRLSVIKSSFGMKPDPIGFKIQESGLTFVDAPQPAKVLSSVERCEEIVRTMLADGPVPAKEIEAAIAAEGISESSLKKVKEKLGIRSTKKGGPKGHWTWSFPNEATNNP